MSLKEVLMIMKQSLSKIASSITFVCIRKFISIIFILSFILMRRKIFYGDPT